jgi:hypothetical protein
MRTWLAPLVLILACSKEDAPTPVPVPVPVPASVSVSASPSATVTAPASATASGPASDGGTCGAVGLPPCPLQGWMKQNMTPAINKQDFDALQTALDQVIAFAPKEPGYPNWVSIAKDTKNAAKSADVGAVRAGCRGCHEQYKAKYKNELRMRPIPPP